MTLNTMENHFVKEEIEQSISRRFEIIVRRYAKLPAVRTARATLTYDALNKAANRVARAIVAQRGAREEPVALLFGHDASAIVALIGILKAGKAYVMLDPSVPKARLTAILEDLDTDTIVTNRDNLGVAQELALNAYQVMDIDRLDANLSVQNLDLSIAPDALAGVFYTSGSSGKPKGVERSQRTILHRIWLETRDCKIGHADKVALVYSCSFGASVTDIFGALLNGATLCLYRIKTHGIGRLMRWLEQEEITLLHLPVTFFRQLLDTLTGEGNFPNLCQITPSGRLFKRDVECFRTHFCEDCVLIQRFSSTETSIVTRFVIDKQTVITSNVVPAGYAVEDKELLILDETGTVRGCDQVGEIAIKSHYLAPGYWRQPDLTQQVFSSDPEGSDQRIYRMGDIGRIRSDGCLEFLRRKDFQVKIRGYRVELMEVEAVFYALAMVNEAVVVACDNQSGEKHLVAYLVPAIHPAPTVSDLRRALAETLPDYMIPAQFVMLEALPLTLSGKVNREALPAPDDSRPNVDTPFVAPRTKLERDLALICEEILGVHPVGVKDNFFDLGGNSLSFVRLLTEIEHLIGKALPVNDLLAAPTIEKITKMLRLLKQTSSLSDQSDHSFPPDGYNPLRVLMRLLRLPHLSWAKKRSRSREIYQEVLSKHGPTFGKVVLPYPLGTRFLTWFCGNRLIQSRLLHKQVRLFQAFLPIVSRSPDDGELIRQHLAANLWKHWRVHALARCTPQQFARWVTVSGLSTLQHAYEQGRGVILVNSHFVMSQVKGLALKSLGFANYQSVGVRSVLQAETSQLRRVRHASGSKAARRSFLHLLSKFHEAQKKLKAGGIMSIAGDGNSGHRSLGLPFHGRQIQFKTGFAEAAVQTGAVTIPAFVSLKPTGHIHVEFLEPLDPGTPEEGHDKRVEGLMQQYVALLEKRWTQDPANLPWGVIERFLASPPLSRGRDA